jgi:DNA-directed RNA polymerase subunit omega
MNPMIMQDCQKVLPNPFQLALAAAARARALRRGAEPKVLGGVLSPTDLALQEIAADLLTEEDFEFLPSRHGGVLARQKPPPTGKTEGDRGGFLSAVASAPH